ncbi:PREDICTED: ADP-ribosylation factor-like protein 14 [Phaethon lepturus]|uniref:ADP-ribosylation factor-like protein 14 n=1 Tax=Phaethon lepturus TaxID=97097 RepID=UPI0005307DD8|nr:PREDICTED: ADP-ribosylation factor-like protein 14 [Phaethon lepturus]
MGLHNTKHSKVKQANILMLGLDSAGKSTLLYKFKYNDVFLTIPTIGFNVDMIETRKDFTLTLWDVGGQEKMRQVWCDFLEDTDGLLYVVDSSDKQRLEESKKEFELILKNEFIKNVPVIMLANKQDLHGALNAEEITRRFNMKKYCSDRNWYVQPCCALTGEGLSEALQTLTTFAKHYSRSKETSTIFKETKTQ